MRPLFASLILLAAPVLAADPNGFALDLYGKLAGEKGNLFFSPYSVSTALGMTWAGARGTTAEELAKTLHFGDDTHTAFSTLNARLIGKQPGYQLSVANRLYVARGFTLLGPFTSLLKDQYAAPVEQVDFTKDETRKRVNTWVEDQTNKRIKDLIPRGVFTGETRLALINAIYFKGTWATEFDKKATTDQPFFTGGKDAKVPLMFAHFDRAPGVRHGQAEGVQVLELPYKGGDVTMVVFLPTARDGLGALEKKLDSAKLEQLLKTLRPTSVDVWLPRFKVEQSFAMAGTLASMGMPSAFASGTADFSGMTGSKGLFISAVIHKAFVEVNEEGTEAAAATGVVMGIESVVVTPTFRADHPFVFALRDTKSGTLLFLGRVVDPR